MSLRRLKRFTEQLKNRFLGSAWVVDRLPSLWTIPEKPRIERKQYMEMYVKNPIAKEAIDMTVSDAVGGGYFTDIKKEIRQKIEIIIGEDINDIYVIGHSLGSVIGYDVLYQILVQNPISDKEKIKAYFSVGSPLDKIAYLFKWEKRTKDEKFPGLGEIYWYNFHELLDPVGANLDLYEHKKDKFENIYSFKYKCNPLSAHIGYWQIPKVMNKIVDVMKIF